MYKMALYLLLFLYHLPRLLAFQDSDSVQISITPENLVYKVNDFLRLTCSINSAQEDVLLEWVVPNKTGNSRNKVDFIHEKNTVEMSILNLQENDSGEYKCRASSNTNPDFMRDKAVRVNVLNLKQKKCNPPSMFPCGLDNCIPERFMCDGKVDCKNGEDEHASVCGTFACKGKLRCGDGRCIPQSWCCDVDHNANCSRLNSLHCCSQLYPEDRLFPPSEKDRYSDVNFIKTTVYTVIGCAMAFMFIVTILVIAICRIHMKRSMMFPCPTQTRSGAYTNLYDLLNIPDDLAHNPLMVTYNINNGVQIVGRPVLPPPYCESVEAPPREGPPPPYEEQESAQIVNEIQTISQRVPESNEVADCVAIPIPSSSSSTQPRPNRPLAKSKKAKYKCGQVVTTGDSSSTNAVCTYSFVNTEDVGAQNIQENGGVCIEEDNGEIHERREEENIEMIDEVPSTSKREDNCRET